MPAYAAASGLKPTARTSKPSVVRLRTSENTTSAPSATKNPMCSPWSCCSPQKTGSRALPAMSFEIGTDLSAAFCSGPPSPNSHSPTQSAIQLSMIVVITSCAPTVAFITPAIPAHAAPASVAPMTAIRMCGTVAIPANL